jgi:2-polyprenyl-3-methyl-5-hydroxy-6-metoxy-1,4-benzoquinol methylase
LYSGNDALNIEMTEEVIGFEYQNAYDLSKYAFDKLISTLNIDFCGLRFGTVCGISRQQRSELLLNSMVKSAVETKTVKILNPKAKRSVLALNDLVHVITRMLEVAPPSGFYNLASYSMSIGEFGKKVAEQLQVKIVNMPDTGTYNFSVESTKIVNALGPVFQKSLTELISDLAEYYQNQLSKTFHDVLIASEAKSCLACGSHALEEITDLGAQPHANDFSENGALKFTEELVLLGCRECGHAQQGVFVKPEILFSDYHYASGTSGTLKKYFRSFADSLAAMHDKESEILEVACNDGSFLEALLESGFSHLEGVDPAENIVKIASLKGLTVKADFFNMAYAARCTKKYDLIIGQNVCAHTPDPLDLLRAAQSILKDDGEIKIQTSQANMLFNGEFDTIYHEHYSFFSAHSMCALAKRAGLVVCDVSYPDIHGTSFLFTLKKQGQANHNVEDRLAFEVGAGLLSGRCFREFDVLARDRVSEYRAHMINWRAQGRCVVGVGAAAKAVTFFNFAEVFPDKIVDEATLKLGRFFPGSQVRVEALASVKACPLGTVFVIGAWNFYAELREKIMQIRGEDGREDIYVRYLPKVEVMECYLI